MYAEIPRTILQVFLDTAPFLLLGLFLAGWLKILIPTEGVHRFLGGRNLKSALYAALLGMPLPICSCGVVPLSVELRRKGASREANLAFLISTPETSADAVAITWGLLGPVMAFARPVAAFLTAMCAALLSVAARRLKDGDTDGDPEPAMSAPPAICADGCGSSACRADGGGYHVVGPRGLVAAVRAALGGRRGTHAAPAPPVSLRALSRDALRYGFVEMLDDLSLWLVIGLGVAGVLAALLPPDLAKQVPGGALGAMLFMLAAGIPIYACAVESTPIAAVLIGKGLSPGAALVFLLSGPATNVATMVLLRRTFGRRFFRMYLAAIAGAAVTCGLLLDALLAATGWSVASRVGAASESPAWRAVAIASALILAALLAASFARLDWRAKWRSARGVADRLTELLGLAGRATTGLRLGVCGAAGALLLILLALWAAAGSWLP